MPVITFNGRSGAVTLLASDVIDALGFTPLQMDSQTIIDLLGYVPADASTTITAGYGIIGGGTIDNDVHLEVDPAVIESDYIKKNNTDPYTPTDDYHPATKKYVDDAFDITIGLNPSVTSFNTRTGAITLTLNDVESVASGRIAPAYTIAESGKILRNSSGNMVWDSLPDMLVENEFNRIAIGENSVAGGSGSVAVGPSAQASNDGSVAYGKNSVSSANNAIAIGNAAKATGSNTIAIGNGVEASSSSPIVIGGGTSRFKYNDTLSKFQVSYNASGSSFHNIATEGWVQNIIDTHVHSASDITSGRFDASRLPTTSGGNNNMVLAVTTAGSSPAYTKVKMNHLDSSVTGAFATNVHDHDAGDITTGTIDDARLSSNIVLSNTPNVKLGLSSVSSANSTVAIGNNAIASANNAIAVGRNTTASSAGSIAIGNSATSQSVNAVAIGSGATANSTHPLMINAGTHRIRFNNDRFEATFNSGSTWHKILTDKDSNYSVIDTSLTFDADIETVSNFSGGKRLITEIVPLSIPTIIGKKYTVSINDFSKTIKIWYEDSQGNMQSFNAAGSVITGIDLSIEVYVGEDPLSVTTTGNDFFDFIAISQNSDIHVYFDVVTAAPFLQVQEYLYMENLSVNFRIIS